MTMPILIYYITNAGQKWKNRDYFVFSAKNNGNSER